jgi:hypothetical protein
MPASDGDWRLSHRAVTDVRDVQTAAAGADGRFSQLTAVIILAIFLARINWSCAVERVEVTGAGEVTRLI